MYSVKLIHFSMRKNIMDFDRLKKFVEHKSSSISNYDLLVLENEYYKQFAEVSESIHLIDSCLYEMDILSYVNKDHTGSFENLAIPNSAALVTNDQKGKLSQIWAKVIEFLKKLWDQLSELFRKAKEFIFTKSKFLINKIDKIIKEIQAASTVFTIQFPDVQVTVKSTNSAFDDLLKLGSIVTENMTLDQTKSTGSKLQEIDSELAKAEDTLEYHKQHPRMVTNDGHSLLIGLNSLKNTLKNNARYVDGYNKNIESAKTVMKKMHPDRFVGQDQTLPTAITSVASSASASYKSAIKYIKNLTDTVENSVKLVENQINEHLNIQPQQ